MGKSRYNWRSFEEARKFVHGLRLKNKAEWAEYAKSNKKPKDIPTDPSTVYKNQWISWGDWLGTGSVKPGDIMYRSFIDARKFVRKLKLKNAKEWREYCKTGKKPKDIPANPAGVYKDEWLDIGDWLGTGFIPYAKRDYLSFEKAKKIVRALKLKNKDEWIQYAKSGRLSKNIPRNPDTIYKDEWKGMGDWLGTGRIANQNRKYLSYEESKQFLKKFHFKSRVEFIKWHRKNNPKNIPTHPDRVYKNEWKGWGDWLGTGRVAHKNMEFLPFEKARKIVRALKLKNKDEWTEYSKTKRPDNIPSEPPQVYKKEWKGWGDWLGTGRIANQVISKNYRPWKEAKPIYQKLAKEYGLKNWSDWTKFARKHNKLLKKLNISATPWKSYSKEKVWRKMNDD